MKTPEAIAHGGTSDFKGYDIHVRTTGDTNIAQRLPHPTTPSGSKVIE
ncbi:MAG: hypothetical protein AAGD22_08425 [Verrucomicrobiota bacterium]